MCPKRDKPNFEVEEVKQQAVSFLKKAWVEKLPDNEFIPLWRRIKNRLFRTLLRENEWWSRSDNVRE